MFVISCNDPLQDSSTRRGTPDSDAPASVSDLLTLVPRNADTYTFANLDRIRDEDLDDLEDQMDFLIGADRLDGWEIDFRDIASLLIADPDGNDNLLILRGEFDFEDIREALGDDSFRDREHRAGPSTM